MKKIYLILLYMLIIPTLLLGNTVEANKEKYSFSAINAEGQTLYYLILSETDHTVAVTKGNKEYKDEKYIIPETVIYNKTTYTVTEIGESAFAAKRKLLLLSSNIKEVILPKSITSIRKNAFYGCYNLKQIYFPKHLKHIEDFAFAYCGLETIELPNSLETLGVGAISNINVKKISIPKTLKTMGSYKGDFIKSWHKYEGYISELPDFITPANCEQTYGIAREAVEAYQAQQLAKQTSTVPQVIYVQGNNNGTTLSNGTTLPAQNTAIKEERKAPSSDVDKDIPTNLTNNTNTFAIIIANENYQEESKVDYALNDGEIFKTYCNKVLGLPEENIHFRPDATLNNMHSEINWLTNVAKAYNGEASLIVYYAGHGIPDEASGSAHLLPIDGKGTILSTGYSLSNLYKILGELPAKSVTVFMDACFSGAQRNGKMLASARGVAIKTKPETPKGKMIVFSAAQGDETAYPYNDKAHGLFTYFLLKKLQETKGDVTYDELAEYIHQEVSRKSIVANSKSQTPTVISSINMKEEWKTMKLK